MTDYINYNNKRKAQASLDEMFFGGICNSLTIDYLGLKLVRSYKKTIIINIINDTI